MADSEEVLEKKRAGGRISGKLKIPKGFARLDPEYVKEMSKRGVEARRRKRESR